MPPLAQKPHLGRPGLTDVSDAAETARQSSAIGVCSSRLARRASRAARLVSRRPRSRRLSVDALAGAALRLAKRWQHRAPGRPCARPTHCAPPAAPPSLVRGLVGGSHTVGREPGSPLSAAMPALRSQRLESPRQSQNSRHSSTPTMSMREVHRVKTVQAVVDRMSRWGLQRGGSGLVGDNSSGSS